MTTTALSDIVSNQYARWMYPEPVIDLPAWLSENWQWFDPQHAHRMFWPDRGYRPDLDILIAGCGTNQAAVIAFTNPEAQVVAVDVSPQSLAHQQFLKEKYSLRNLQLHLLPIEEINTLGKDFDLIISTGVLHHLASPQSGMNALAQCLRQEGVASIMLYAKYGRIGVDMMQSVFRDMGLVQDEPSVRRVREVLNSLPRNHPIQSYMAIAPDLNYDAGLVDTFLHGRDRNFSIPECVNLVTNSGLVFQDVFFKAPYYPWPFASGQLHTELRKMSREQQWSVMERVNFHNACHFFTACRSDRPKKRYLIDFSTKQSIDYVPMFRNRCHANEQIISRHDWSMGLNQNQSAILQLVDGQRTIKDITKQLSQRGDMQGQSTPMVEQSIAQFFQALWQLDFLAMGLKTEV